ncbi:MAG: sugar ABC transporter permease [Defluviitaleaceae bacterium]|nr:sugar ABC transporter permease [Defluviitaleaceae bacterium]
MTKSKSSGGFKFRRPGFQTSRKINAYVLLIPFLAGFFLFFAVPIYNLIVFSLSRVEVAEEGGMMLTFVGFENFVDLFMVEVSTANQQFLRVFADENMRIFMNAPIMVIFSLFAALLVNVKFRGRGFVRVIFFLPIVTGLPIVQSLLTVTTGADIMDASIADTFITTTIMSFLISYTFLPIALISFIATVAGEIFFLISNVGVQTLIFLAGLQSINPSLYEVAKIEGANEYETFWKITLPMLTNVIVFVIVYSFVDLFLDSPLANEVYAYGFLRNNIGMGASLSLIYMINVVLGLLVLLYAFRKVAGKHDS